MSYSLRPRRLYVAHQAPLSMGFSRQEYWSGLPCPPPEDLPNPGIEPRSLTSSVLARGFFFTTSATWEVRLLVPVVILCLTFLRNHHTIFHHGCTILHSCQACTEVPIAPRPHQQSFLSFFFFLNNSPPKQCEVGISLCCFTC